MGRPLNTLPVMAMGRWKYPPELSEISPGRRIILKNNVPFLSSTLKTDSFKTRLPVTVQRSTWRIATVGRGSGNDEPPDSDMFRDVLLRSQLPLIVIKSVVTAISKQPCIQEVSFVVFARA